MKIALITGITGQDGAYLAEFLLNTGYVVYGGYRRTSSVNLWRLAHLGIESHPNLHLVEHDITDLSTSIRLIERIKPSEIYNLAAQSFVGVSFEQPLSTAQITGVGVVNILEAIRLVNPHIRFYQASTSEMFGKVQATPQDESTPFYPRSPYGVAKLFAHWTTINYREAYGIFATSGILFNHESPLRGQEFVTRKISNTLAQIKLGKQSSLSLGNLDAVRDWGFAKEYVVGMWKMLQADTPSTYVLATGSSHSVRDFVTAAGKFAGFDLQWKGAGVDEVGIDRISGKQIVRVDPNFYRPTEVESLIGDSSKARVELGWEPSTTFDALCEMMVSSDIRRNEAGESY